MITEGRLCLQRSQLGVSRPQRHAAPLRADLLALVWCITMADTIRHHISSADLLDKLGLSPLDTYNHRRLLRWAGRVSRMPMSRAPRRLLTGWVAHKRQIGCLRK